MRDNKKVLSQLPRLQALALSALLIAPLALAVVPGFVSLAPPPFNIVISNVPGVREPMYWNGARLEGNYPLGIALGGQAVNITLANNADNRDFGLVGCRRSVPHLQRLLGHLEDALKIWNALSAFRIRSRTTTAAAPAAGVEVGIAARAVRRSPPLRHPPRRRPTRPLTVDGRGWVPACLGRVGCLIRRTCPAAP